MGYVWHTLAQAYPEQAFALGPDLMADYASNIAALPNRTPNGVVLPRRETFHSFNLIHQALAGIFDELSLLSRFSLIQMPINVRIVSGAPNPEADTRRYSSAKMHTDVWNGEPISSVLINIPVLGDPRAVDLRFFEPRHFPESLRVPLSDYSLGKDVVASVEEYPMSFDIGNIYLSDSLSLHQTTRRRPLLRLSLDFRAIAVELLPEETGTPTASHAVYVAPEVWREAGSTLTLGSGEPIDGFHRRQKGEVVKRDSLSIVSTDDLHENCFVDCRGPRQPYRSTLAQVEFALPSSVSPQLSYRELTMAEGKAVETEVESAIATRDLRVVGGNDPTVWEHGWGELALALVDRDITLDALRPQYFHGEPVCRLEHRYVRGSTPGFEYDVGLALRRILFDEFLHGFHRIVEFGCGTGLNLLLLAEHFPGVSLIGTDWAIASQRLLRTISAKLGSPINGRRFNMLTPEPWPEGPFGEGTAVLTVHAMEQLGTNWRPFADFLQTQSAGLCIHIEPLFELYDQSSTFDQHAIRYHLKRGYLRVFSPTCASAPPTEQRPSWRNAGSRSAVSITKPIRSRFGGRCHDGTAVLAGTYNAPHATSSVATKRATSSYPYPLARVRCHAYDPNNVGRDATSAVDDPQF